MCVCSAMQVRKNEWEQKKNLCVCVCVHTCTRASLNEVFDAFSASCSEAFDAIAGAEMDAANFSISKCVKEREQHRAEGGKTKYRGQNKRHQEGGGSLLIPTL